MSEAFSEQGLGALVPIGVDNGMHQVKSDVLLRIAMLPGSITLAQSKLVLPGIRGQGTIANCRLRVASCIRSVAGFKLNQACASMLPAVLQPRPLNPPRALFGKPEFEPVAGVLDGVDPINGFPIIYGFGWKFDSTPDPSTMRMKDEWGGDDLNLRNNDCFSQEGHLFTFQIGGEVQGNLVHVPPTSIPTGSAAHVFAILRALVLCNVVKVPQSSQETICSSSPQVSNKMFGLPKNQATHE